MTLWKGFQKPKRLEADLETLSNTFGKFFAQPFERGFGTTIGNALRRVLLSSIEGAAITAVKIDGVLHAYFWPLLALVSIIVLQGALIWSLVLQIDSGGSTPSRSSAGSAPPSATRCGACCSPRSRERR